LGLLNLKRKERGKGSRQLFIKITPLYFLARWKEEGVTDFSKKGKGYSTPFSFFGIFSLSFLPSAGWESKERWGRAVEPMAYRRREGRGFCPSRLPATGEEEEKRRKRFSTLFFPFDGE